MKTKKPMKIFSSKVRWNKLFRELSALQKIEDEESFIKHFKYIISDWKEIVSFSDLKIRKEILVLSFYENPYQEGSLEEFLDQYKPVDIWDRKRELLQKKPE